MEHVEGMMAFMTGGAMKNGKDWLSGRTIPVARAAAATRTPRAPRLRAHTSAPQRAKRRTMLQSKAWKLATPSHSRLWAGICWYLMVPPAIPNTH